ncbi:hypothetical protein [Pseudalkalibacillus decolorationis]|uniref:hypothetical protein n=1 Tax=Pseudalkalibacillus decolorationis TaxID=163879 RepID=UPI0021497CAA|nr:hypothetical protein [Pseudalkalibacillus decolorationis]
MPKFLFEVSEVQTLEKESDDQMLENKLAIVKAEVINKESGTRICKGVIPVMYNDDGVYPSISTINSLDASKYIKTELMFRSKRYIKKLRRWL